MGSILEIRRSDKPGKVIVEVQLDQEELRQLRGEMDEIYLFTGRAASLPSKVSLRGRNEATQYFLIPRQLRKRLPVHGSVGCQRLDTDGKVIFVYTVDPCRMDRGYVAG